jgi:hypothetical protein
MPKKTMPKKTMPKKTLTRMGLPVFAGLIVGGMLYLLLVTLEFAPLFGDIDSSMASDVTNVGYPP